MPYFYLIFLIGGADQILKLIVQNNLAPFQSWQVLQGLVALTYTENFGAAFGILQSQTVLFIGLTVLMVALVWFYRHQLPNYPRLFQIGLAIALGGALGNFIDRIRLGYVIDYIELPFWPVFNLADMAIVIGAGLLIWAIYTRDLVNRKTTIKKGNSGQTYSKGTTTKEEPN